MQHQDHDSSLIAAHAAGDLCDSERTRAQAFLDTCRPCAELRNDLVAIAAATRTLPNLATAPRDFRLSMDQAARLRRGSWVRAVLAPFGGARSAVRPIAAAFTSLGLAGFLVATVLPGLIASPASMGIDRDQTGGGAPAATTAPDQPIGAAGQPTPPAPNGPATGVDSVATAAPGNGEFGTKDNTGGTAPSSPPAPAIDGDPSDGSGRASVAGPASLLLVGSLALLAIGLALFGLRIVGRRLRP